MKKILPCSLWKMKLLSLLLFVSLGFTNVFAQDPPNCGAMSTLPVRTCVNGNALYSPSVNPESVGKAVTWTMTVNTTGAIFVESGTSAPLHKVLTGTPADVIAVKVGPNAGTLTVVLSYDGSSEGSCSASRIVRKVAVSATAPPLKCAQDLATITAVATTQSTFGGPFVPSPPYLYTLLPEGTQNLTGVFTNVSAGPHTIQAKENMLEGCDATTDINIIAPPVIIVTPSCPGDFLRSACLYDTQDQVQADFAAFVAAFNVTGGTGIINKVITYDPAGGLAPDKCGGTVKVTITGTDECQQTGSCSATFTITPPTPVVPHAPAPVTIKYCDLRNIDLAAVFKAWLAEFSAGTGGCAPTLIPIPHGEPGTCGGDGILVRFTVHDKCRLDTEISSTFTVERPLAPHIDQIADRHLLACVSQGDLDAAWDAFLGSVHANDECGVLPVTHGSPIKPDRCLGGDVPVTFIANPNCFPPLEVTAHFIVDAAPKPTIDACPADVDLKCNPVFPIAKTLIVVNTTCPAQQDITDGPTTGDACNKTFTRTYTIGTDCYPASIVCHQVFKWSEDTGVRNVVCAPGKDLGCNPVGLPDVVNPTYDSNCPADVTHVDLPATGDDCAKTQIRRFTIKTACDQVGVNCDQTFTFKIDKVVPVITKTGTCPTDVKCNPTDAEIEAMLGGATATDNCDGVITDKLVVTTGDAVNTHDCFFTKTRTWNVKDKCDNAAAQLTCTITYKVDKDGPVLSGLVNINIPGGDEDSGLCTPTTTVGGKSFTPPAFKGSTGVSVDFGQVRTGDAPSEQLTWTNGTTTAQSEYFEGMCVPQRILLQGLKKGKHTLYIRHEAVKKQDDSRHAYDFLTGWDNAYKTAQNIGNGTRNELQNLFTQECDGKWSGAGEADCRTMTNSVKADIPDLMGNPPNQTGIANVDDVISCFESKYDNRQMEFEAKAPISGQKVTFLGYDGSATKDNFAWYSIEWTSDSSVMEIKFAGRMAMGGGECGYGNCHGAGSVHGNPYHIIIEGMDGAGIGQRDNQTKCKRSQTCDVNIPVKFPPVTATDCDPVHPVVELVGPERITTLPNGDVQHCQDYKAVDQCGNPTTGTSCITVQCVLGANFGDTHILRLGAISAPTSKGTGYVAPLRNEGITKLVAYPNPFRSNFNVDISTTSIDPINVNVYDMLGRSIETRTISPDNSGTELFGGGYPTGIYNLTFNQATEQKTLRVIKQ